MFTCAIICSCLVIVCNSFFLSHKFCIIYPSFPTLYPTLFFRISIIKFITMCTYDIRVKLRNKFNQFFPMLPAATNYGCLGYEILHFVLCVLFLYYQAKHKNVLKG